MRTIIFIGISLFLTPLCFPARSSTLIATFSDRMPSYFVDRYGSPKSSKDVSTYHFIHPGHGNVVVKGPFTVREFRSGDLRVQAIFRLPSLKLAAVKLYLPRQWTAEQINAALTAYGDNWNASRGSWGVKVWTARDKSRAIAILLSLEIQAPEVIESMERVLHEREAKRKAVPKF